jgi:LPXTG-motif cell wall-anchored protein
MKHFLSKFLVFTVFFLVFTAMVQSADAMGLNPWRHGGGGQGGTQGVPEPLTTLSLLGIGVAGAGAYLFIRKKKDK